MLGELGRSGATPSRRRRPWPVGPTRRNGTVVDAPWCARQPGPDRRQPRIGAILVEVTDPAHQMVLRRS